MPPPEASLRSQINGWFISGIFFVVIVGGAILAWHHVKRQRGDLRGAFRLATAVFWAQMSLWVVRGHFTASVGTFGTFILALCFALFYAAVMWTVYVALEPYARRHWPQALISWTGVLSGRWRDPIVGRDVLFGTGLTVCWLIIDRLTDLWGQAHGVTPNVGNLSYLDGGKGALGVILAGIPNNIRAALMLFFILFVMRALLRKQWLAGVVFVLFWSVQLYFQVRSTTAIMQAVEAAVLYAIVVAVVLRFGLLCLAVGTFLAEILGGLPLTFNPSAWYFSTSIAVFGGALALVVWAFYTSMAGRRLWSDDLFG